MIGIRICVYMCERENDDNDADDDGSLSLYIIKEGIMQVASVLGEQKRNDLITSLCAVGLLLKKEMTIFNKSNEHKSCWYLFDMLKICE